MRTTLRRWVRFNLVGAAGALVQLAAVHGLNACFRGHYLWATALALEVTLLHNFCWHVRYTWGGRLAARQRVAQLLRFHFSNGAVSLGGNLLLMRLLVGEEHVSPVVANGAAIGVCSVVNFLLSDRWAFASGARVENSPSTIGPHSDHTGECHGNSLTHPCAGETACSSGRMRCQLVVKT